MKNEHYTKEGKHPEDVIYEVKQFLNELSKIQEERFVKLCTDLRFNESGESYLFDYIHNFEGEEKDLTFEEYISNYGKTYEQFVKS